MAWEKNDKPCAPRNWELTAAFHEARKTGLTVIHRNRARDKTKRMKLLRPDSRKNKDQIKVTLPKFSWDES